MDSFVCDKLKEWHLDAWIQKFKDQRINKKVLYLLNDEDINKLIPDIGSRVLLREGLRLLRGEQNTDQDTDDVSIQALPSPSNKGKRKLDHQGESSKSQPGTKKQCSTSRESKILSDVKETMKDVRDKVTQENGDLISFLKSKIDDLKRERRELVGIFGKTGAGKSSLINAVIRQQNLLPSGSVNACTSVMIKVEANMSKEDYEAEIEFITKEEWENELFPMIQTIRNCEAQELDNEDDDDDDDDDDDEYQNCVEKLSALYGEEWKEKTPKSLMDRKYFKEIPEFLKSKSKTLPCESAEDLSAKIEKYTKSKKAEGKGKGAKRWYWPLVKNVTVKVPQNDLLQHVTLVDLPGMGDRNKSRDQMWKGIIGNCSTVWIVTDINRAVAEKEAWEILKSAARLLGNGGECQRIHFICTKSDVLGGVPPSNYVGKVTERNKYVKTQLKEEFSKQRKVKKHISDDCFEVFTVSSTEFFSKQHLTEEKDTEIPELQKFLKKLNDCHSETLNYLSGARGILSLIQGASRGEAGGKKSEVCEALEEKKRQQLQLVEESMGKHYNTFEKCLTERAKTSKDAYEQTLGSFLNPRDGRGFHRTLKCVVKNGGVRTQKNGIQLNLNVMLASFLTDVIDEEFKQTFPNDTKCDPFSGAIKTFSLDTEGLIDKYKDVELQLTFLKTEEDIMKTELKTVIRDRKKKIYNSLMETIEKSMQDCYKRAAEFKGLGSLQNMRNTIESHVRDPNNTMFEEAKDEMLKQLKDLMNDVLKILDVTMNQSIMSALKTEEQSIPDVSAELEKVEKLYNELKRTSDMET